MKHEYELLVYRNTSNSYIKWRSTMQLLTITEQMYLVAILCLPDNAYGVKIREKVIELTGRSMVFGTLYNNLDQLVRKGYVETQKGEKGETPSGNTKVFYHVTSTGKKALCESRSLQNSLWSVLPENALI